MVLSHNTHTHSPPYTSHPYTITSYLTIVPSLRLSLMILCTNSTSPPAVMVSYSFPVFTVDGTGLLPERATPPYLSSPSPKKGGLQTQKWYCCWSSSAPRRRVSMDTCTTNKHRKHIKALPSPVHFPCT